VRKLAAGAFLVVENNFATESMMERRGRTAPLRMVDAFYFVATTISTVGSDRRTSVYCHFTHDKEGW
jgi:hypothetical protein